MKLLKGLVLTLTMAFTGLASAHSDGHGQVDARKAIEVAHKITQKMTFKDQGMSVGKIDSSWNKVSKSSFMLAEQNSHGFIIKAVNSANKQTLFYMINKNGQVNAVKDASEFGKSHGHSH